MDDGGHPTLDQEWLGALVDRLGPDKVIEYLASFVEEAASLMEKRIGEDPVATGKLAHRLVGSAGQLGFTALSVASRELMLACHERPGSMSQAGVATRLNLRLAIEAGRAMIGELAAREGTGAA